MHGCHTHCNCNLGQSKCTGISAHHLQLLPSDIQSLYIYNSNISSFSTVNLHLPNLRNLYVKDTQLTSLVIDDNMPALRIVTVINGNLQTFETIAVHASLLTTLNLRHQPLVTPTKHVNLLNVQILQLTNTSMSEYNSFIFYMPSLNNLNINDSPLIGITMSKVSNCLLQNKTN